MADRRALDRHRRQDSVAKIPQPEEVPVAVAAYPAEKGLPEEVAIASALIGRERGRAHIRTRPTGKAVTLAAGGVAETGGLIFRSSPQTSMPHNFLDPDHVAVVEAVVGRTKIGCYPESAFRSGCPAPARIMMPVTGTKRPRTAVSAHFPLVGGRIEDNRARVGAQRLASLDRFGPGQRPGSLIIAEGARIGASLSAACGRKARRGSCRPVPSNAASGANVAGERVGDDG